MAKSTSSWLVPLILIVAAAAVLWYLRYYQPERPPAVPAPAEPAARSEPEPETPRYPLPRISGDAGIDETGLTPLPALDDSDGYFALELVALLGRDIEELLVDSALIEKFVISIDNLPRDRVAERVRPLKRLPNEFLTGEAATGDGFVLAAENYARYDGLVAMLVGTDMDAVIDAYRRFYPLFQEAYLGLGYPDGYFNDRVIEVIDHLLETPEPAEPIRLVRPHVLYEYADPELEALSGGQKLLIRMGSDNAAEIKATLTRLRARLVSLAATARDDGTP